MKWIFKVSECRMIDRTLIDRNRDRQHPELGRITKEDVNFILRESWRNYEILKADAPNIETPGGRYALLWGIRGLSLYQAIRKFGADKDYAKELAADISWKHYKKSLKIPRLIAKIKSRKPQKQFIWLQRLALNSLLKKPGYDWENVKMDGDVTSFDIVRCPVNDFYKSRPEEEIEFFRYSWCTFDFPLAEYLVKGGRYERMHTLSAGDDRCDMRNMIINPNLSKKGQIRLWAEKKYRENKFESPYFKNSE